MHFTFQIKELLNSHVHIQDKEYVSKVLSKMIEGGPDKLQVLFLARFSSPIRKYRELLLSL